MLRPGQSLMLCVLALLTLGVVMVNSAGMSLEPGQAVTLKSILLSRSTVYMALAVAAMGVCAGIPRTLLARFTELQSRPGPAGNHAEGLSPSVLRLIKDDAPLWLGVGVLVALLMLVHVPGLGREVNHSARWIGVVLPGLGEVRAQPSELAKWGLVALIAWYAARKAAEPVENGGIGRFFTGLFPGLAAAGLVAAMIAKEDLGTGVLVGAVAAVILIAAGAKLWQLALLAPVGLAGVVALVIVSPYRLQRLTSFLDPYADPQDTGYHMIQSMVAVANGHVFGRGLGHGLDKFGYLPEDTTDFLFAVICEELGLAGALLVLALYAGLLLSGLAIVRREKHPMLKLVGVGVLATVGLQAVINLFVVTGLGPTKGIALPLLSSGGTGWILTAASLGLLAAMDKWHAAEGEWDDEPGDEPESDEPIARRALSARAAKPVIKIRPVPALSAANTEDVVVTARAKGWLSSLAGSKDASSNAEGAD